MADASQEKLPLTEKYPWILTLLYALFSIIPHHFCGKVIQIATRSKVSWFKNLLISWFVKNYNIETGDTLHKKARYYPDFKSFFTRQLRSDLRPLPKEPDAICSPVDARVMTFGTAHEDEILQAKGVSYSIRGLLGGKAEWYKPFINGSYINLYLSPADYHRIHIPANGTLKEMIHIPGRAFAVAPWSSKRIPGLFSRNERVVCLFETKHGLMAVVMIGAFGVGSIETTWSGVVTPPHAKTTTNWIYAPPCTVPFLTRGDEMGRFNMGSSVIVLFEKDKVNWDASISEGEKVLMGQKIGNGKL